MKLLRIIPSMDPKVGGPPEGIRNITPHLAENGIITTIVSSDNLTADFGDKNLDIIKLGGRMPLWSFTPNLAKWLHVNLCKYDAVICHGMWLYHSFAVRSAIMRLRKSEIRIPKLYLMPHGMLDPYFQKSKTRRLKSIRNYIYWLLIERFNVQNSDGMLFTCDEEMLLARCTFPYYQPKNTYNVGYGIKAPPKFTNVMMTEFRKLVSLEFGKKYFLYLSRVHPKKGIDILINSFADTALNHDLDLVICGPYDQSYKDKLLHKVKLDICKRIHFCGNLRGDAKWGAIYGCDAFILPSHQENFGIAIVEALACGKPVLISNKVNIWREIISGGAGYVSEDTSDGVDELLLKWISQSPESIKMMSQKALDVYRENFFIDKTASALISVIADSKNQ